MLLRFLRFLLFGLLMVPVASSGQSKNIPEDVEHARQHGLTEIQVPAPKVALTLPTNIDRALKQDSVVIASLEKQVSTFYDEDKTAIVTWFKFRLMEQLSGRQPLTAAAFPKGAPEAVLTNANGNSFVIRVFGGTLYLNGVKVDSQGAYPHLTTGTKYLLFVFVDQDESGQTVLGLNYGAEGIIKINDDGLVTPLGSHGSAISRFLTTHAIRDVSALRKALLARLPQALR